MVGVCHPQTNGSNLSAREGDEDMEGDESMEGEGNGRDKDPDTTRA